MTRLAVSLDRHGHDYGEYSCADESPHARESTPVGTVVSDMDTRLITLSNLIDVIIRSAPFAKFIEMVCCPGHEKWLEDKCLLFDIPVHMPAR